MFNLILSLVLLLLPYRLVDATNATCVAGYTWMYNSLGQNPCDIAAELGGVCTGGGFTVSALLPGYHYPGPSVDDATTCRCNTVYYSLIAACSACQQRNFVKYSSYTSNCKVVYSQRYPETIPSDTAVPHYAYLDVETNDTFSLASAQAAGGPESTGAPDKTDAASSTALDPATTTTSVDSTTTTSVSSKTTTSVNSKTTTSVSSTTTTSAKSVSSTALPVTTTMSV